MSLFLISPSQINTWLLPQPALVNYLISLPDTYKKDEIQSGARTALCSSRPHWRPALRDTAQYPPLGNSHSAGGKAKLTPYAQIQGRHPPNSQLHQEQAGLGTAQGRVFERPPRLSERHPPWHPAPQGSVRPPGHAACLYLLVASALPWRCWVGEQMSPTRYE